MNMSTLHSKGGGLALSFGLEGAQSDKDAAFIAALEGQGVSRPGLHVGIGAGHAKSEDTGS